ncbi:MAG: calcium/sodium antiporter, partial [Methyloligellaceae bacterium]
MDIAYFAAGFALLFIGGELLVRGSVTIAKSLGLSSLLIGLTVVGFGTSSPELITSITAALNDNADIAIGNVVGSNIANVLLILGMSAIIYPISFGKTEIYRDSIIGVLAAIILGGLSVYGAIPRSVGFFLFAAMVMYLVYSYLSDKGDKANTDEVDTGGNNDLVSFLKAFIYCIVSLALLYFGARWLVFGAVNIATELKVPPSVIGLTMVAVGTSLPELATSLVAAMRKQTDIAIGNILGSNLFNIFAVLGLTSIISPLKFEGKVAETDVWIMLAVAFVLLFFVRVRPQMGRLLGAAFLITYI